MKDVEKDPIYPHMVLLKCLAALLLMVIIAAGPWVFVTTTNDFSAGAAPEQNGQPTQSIPDGNSGSVASIE